jgi:hypothetical protein
VRIQDDDEDAMATALQNLTQVRINMYALSG